MPALAAIPVFVIFRHQPPFRIAATRVRRLWMERRSRTGRNPCIEGRVKGRRRTARWFVTCLVSLTTDGVESAGVDVRRDTSIFLAAGLGG